MRKLRISGPRQAALYYARKRRRLAMPPYIYGALGVTMHVVLTLV